jgi:hypothetical protein
MIESLGSYEGVWFVPPEDPAAIRDALVNIYRERGKRYPVPESLRWDRIAIQWREFLIQGLETR